MSERCITCGSPVRVVGGTTKHYEPVPWPDTEGLRERVEAERDLLRMRHEQEHAKRHKDSIAPVLATAYLTAATRLDAALASNPLGGEARGEAVTLWRSKHGYGVGKPGPWQSSDPPMADESGFFSPDFEVRTFYSAPPAERGEGRALARVRSDVNFTIGQLQGALKVLRSGSEIDRDRFISLLVDVVARLQDLPFSDSPPDQSPESEDTNA